jgi:aryl-phospho-beta-D-glucosidase BglC (GH1 family)
MKTTIRAVLVSIGFLAGSTIVQAQLDPAFVKADGYVLRDQAGTGKILKLRGFNLGGWLFQESWMSPTLVNDPTATGGTRGAYQPEIDAILTQRFGREVKNQLIRDFQNAWITTVDLDNLAAHGVNLLRVPFSYLTLMEEDGTWKPDAEAFDRLDWIVSQAWARGIYCILDFHNAQGGQNGSGFWSNTLYQDRAVQIWQKVATRYVGNPAVAGYDLLNEPMGASGSTQWNFVDRCYDAVRAIDPDHLVLVEAVWDLNALPKTTTYGWTNVSYSLHWYPWNQTSTQMMATLESDMAKLQANTDLGPASGKVVPYNIGEFSYWDSPDVWRRAMREFYQRNYSWTSWTYKTRNMGAWGLYNPNRPQPNISTETAEQISAKWTAYATGSLTDARNSYLRDLISSPVATADSFTVPSGGNLVIPHSALLANDSSQSAARDLTIADPGTPSHGSLIAIDANNFLYVPAPGHTGTAEFTYLAFDRTNGLGSPHAAKVTLTITNPPSEPVPYALNDVHTALRDTPLTIAAPGLLGNDGDLSSRPLTAELVSGPASSQGTVSLQPNGGFTFTPAAGFTGLATFTYRPMAGAVAGAPATVSVRVASPMPSGQNGLFGEYYASSTNWTGSFSTRIDPEINFSWSSTTGPGLGMPGTNYSVKWKGWITAPYSGTWTITETSDDGFGVYVDGVAVVEDWPAHGPREKSGTVTLTGGQPRYLEVYHVNYGGGAVAKLEWSHPLVARQVVPQAWLTTAAPTFPTLTANETWRYGYFSTIANSGTAADDADPDGDGFTNLAEFNAGTHPLSAASTPPPNDTVPPVVTVPSDLTVEATGPSGAVATFTTSALDDVSGVLPTVNTPASGSVFPLGGTTVTATATDAAGNAGSASFTVTVVDTTAPAITVPADITVAASGPGGANVNFITSASDLVSGTVSTLSNPPSGSLFPIGTTTVTVTATDAAGNSASRTFTVTVTRLPAPWLDADIGSTGLAGSALHNAGTFTIAGAGAGITGSADACRYVYQTATGDCDVIVRVQSLTNTGSNAKAGVMIRESLAANAREAGVWVTPTSGIQFTRRTSTGGSTSVTSSSGKIAPYWVRLTRTGNTFRAFMSTNGTTWTQLGKNTNISMATSTSIGFAVTSGSTATLCTGVLTNTAVTP